MRSRLDGAPRGCDRSTGSTRTTRPGRSSRLKETPSCQAASTPGPFGPRPPSTDHSGHPKAAPPRGRLAASTGSVGRPAQRRRPPATTTQRRPATNLKSPRGGATGGSGDGGLVDPSGCLGTPDVGVTGRSVPTRRSRSMAAPQPATGRRSAVFSPAVRRGESPGPAPAAMRLLLCEAAVGESVRPATCDPAF